MTNEICLCLYGPLILRDVISDDKVLAWLMNTFGSSCWRQIYVSNMAMSKCHQDEMVRECTNKQFYAYMKFEIRKGMRMHCVVRKPMGKAIGNER